MATPSSVITYGLGAPGSASLLITLGFGSGAEATDSPTVYATLLGIEGYRAPMKGIAEYRAELFGIEGYRAKLKESP